MVPRHAFSLSNPAQEPLSHLRSRSGRTAFAALALAAALVAAPRDAHAECTKDTDCKGDRICSAGACVEPGQTTGGATGAPTSAEPSPPPSHRGAWYGWQTLAMDGSALIIMSIGAGLWSGPDEGAGLITSLFGWAAYAIATPIDHWVHGNVVFGFGSLAGRLGLIGMEIAIMKTTADTNGGYPTAVGPVVAEIGMAVGSALDAIFLAYDKKPERRTTSFVPWVTPVDGTSGVAAGVAGIF